MNYQDVSLLDAAFAALANPVRRRMVEHLALQPASIQQLARMVSLSLPAIHRHVRVLEDAGLIQRKKVGRVNFLAVKRAGIRSVQGWMHSFNADWGSDEESLDNYVAGIVQDSATIPPRSEEMKL